MVQDLTSFYEKIGRLSFGHFGEVTAADSL